MLRVVTSQQMAAEGQCDRMASDLEVCVELRYGTEFFHSGKKAPADFG